MGLMDGTGTRTQSVKPHINVHQRSCRNKSSLKAVSQHVQIRAFVYHAALCDGHWLGGFVRICVDLYGSIMICVDLCVCVDLCGFVWICVDLCGFVWICNDL